MNTTDKTPNATSPISSSTSNPTSNPGTQGTTDGGAFVNTNPSALDRLLPRITGLAREDVRHVNADLEFAVSIVRSRAAKVRALRGELARLPDFDLAAVDELDNLADALAIADARCRVPDKLAGIHVGQLAEEGFALRRVFATAWTALVTAGKAPPESEQVFRGTTQYADLAADLEAAAELFEKRRPDLRAMTPITEAQLRRADELGRLLGVYVAERDAGLDEREARVDVRDRVWTLFHDAWIEVRRGVQYLRTYEGDAEQIAPNLWARSDTRSRKDADTPAPGPTPKPGDPKPVDPKTTAPKEAADDNETRWPTETRLANGTVIPGPFVKPEE